PALLRALRPDVRIGFFWHIPWPGREILRALPWADELVDGLLGADLLGLHVPRYVRAFRGALVELGVPHDAAGGELLIERSSHRAVVAPCPIGIDVARWVALGEDESVMSEATRLRGELGGDRILLAVDRMDYTKGILERLNAFERVLEAHEGARR